MGIFSSQCILGIVASVGGAGMRFLTRSAHALGNLRFLAVFTLLFNIVTFVWVFLGIWNPPWWPDPYPSNFYTLTVSWLAINMSIWVLLMEHLRRQQDERKEALDRKILRAVYALVLKADQDQENYHEVQKSILALLESQMRIIETLSDKEPR